MMCVGGECYAPLRALRRGYVHQLIHNNFHSDREAGRGSAELRVRRLDAALQLIAEPLSG